MSHPLDAVEVGESFTYEKPYFDWDWHVVRKYGHTLGIPSMREALWIEELYFANPTEEWHSGIRSIRVVSDVEAKELYEKFKGKV